MSLTIFRMICTAGCDYPSKGVFFSVFVAANDRYEAEDLAREDNDRIDNVYSVEPVDVTAWTRCRKPQVL